MHDNTDILQTEIAIITHSRRGKLFEQFPQNANQLMLKMYTCIYMPHHLCTHICRKQQGALVTGVSTSTV